MTAEDLVALARAGAPLDRQRDALAEVLRGRGVTAPTIERLMEHVRDGIVLKPSSDEASTSRIGGPGLLPVGEPWPTNAGGPLSLVAAIALAELPALEPLPTDGTLLLYWDFTWFDLEHPDFVVATRALWIPDGETMNEQPQPSGTFREFERLPVTGLAMPIAGEPQNVLLQLQDAPDRQALLDAMNDLAPALYGHQLLGAPREIQGPVLDEISYWFKQTFPETRERFTEEERSGEGWVLLAQIEEDRDVPSLLIGDGGKLYFVIPEDDLVERRFDRVMGVMQCH